MAANARSKRGAFPAPTPRDLDLTQLSAAQRLVLAQAVYELGPDNWDAVANLLSAHAFMSSPNTVITSASCSAVYASLMKQVGLERPEGMSLKDYHKLFARHFYDVRMDELKDLIVAEENKFKEIASEIEQIRKGSWDERISESMGVASHGVEDVYETPMAAESVYDPASLPDDAPQSPVVQEPLKEPEMDLAPPPSLTREVTSETNLNEGARPTVDHVPADVESLPETRSLPEPSTVIAHTDTELAASESFPYPGSSDAMEVDEQTKEPSIPVKPVAEEEEEEEEDEDEEPLAASSPRVHTGEASTPTTPGTSQIPDGKRKASEEPLRERKRQRDDSEPADDDDSAPKARRQRTTTGGDGGGAPVVSKRFQNVIGMLHSQISQHRYGNIFHNPIKKSEAPDYHDIVKKPMDLKTIKARVKDGVISNSLEFQRDVFLMFANAMMYNRPGSDVYHMAEEMMVFSEKEINAFRHTEGFHRA